MRIAIVTDSFHPTRDGVVACIDVMRSVLVKGGIETAIVAPDPGKGQRDDGIYYFPSIGFKNYPGYYVPIFPSNKKEVLQEIAPDVVHIQGVAVMALKGVIAAHNLGLPVVLTFHTMVGDTMKYYSPIKMPQKTAENLVWLYLRYLTRWVDAIVAPTESTANELKSRGITVEDIRVIPTPIDTERFSPKVSGDMVRERYNLKGKKVVACVGRVSFEKNIDMLVRSVKELDDDTVLMVVGKGPASDSLKALSEELGISDRVILTGFVPDDELVQHYAAADVVATASKFETQCLTALEAMSCGKVVVCVNARAFADYVVDGKNGYLFEDSVESCSGKLKEALSASDDIREKAIATASGFSVDGFVKNMSQLYEDVVKRKKGV